MVNESLYADEVVLMNEAMEYLKGKIVELEKWTRK